MNEKEGRRKEMRDRVRSPEHSWGDISVAVPPTGGEGVAGILCLDQPGDPLIGAPLFGSSSLRVPVPHPRWSHRGKADAVGTYTRGY